MADLGTQRQDGEGGGGFSLDRALAAVRRRWKLVAAMPIAAAVLASVVVLSMPDRYDASATVQIDPRRKSISNLEGVISELKADTATVESEVEIIRSRAIALKVIDVLKLRQDPDFARTSLKGRVLAFMGLKAPDLPEPVPGSQEGRTINSDPIKGLLGPDEVGKSRPVRDEVAVAFSENLKVTRVRNSLLIDIRFSASEAVKAARIANTIAEVYLAEQLSAKQEVAGHASKLLEEKLEQLRGEVTNAEQRVAEYKSANNIFDAEGQILGEKQMARLMEQTVVARNSTAEARARYELAQRLAASGDNGSGIADVLQSHTVRLLKEQLAKATGKEAELSTRYGPRHPDMQKIRAEVRDARAQVDMEIERLVTNLKNEYEIAVNREKELQSGLERLKSDDATSKNAGVRLKELMREAETSRALYEALLSRYKQTVETQNLQLPDARIVEQADAPLFPAAPKRKQIVAIAAFGGLTIAIVITLLLEFMIRGIGRPEDVERLFELAHLASLPTTPSGAQGSVSTLREIRLMVAEPLGPFAEQIRALRREVDVRRQSHAPRVIQVVSSLPNEGTTLVSSNLAHHYAMTGARVLLIDGDLRRALLTRQLAAPRQAGLAEVLGRTLPLEAALLHDGATGLTFLPAIGPAPSLRSPPELLASADMAWLLARLKAYFDVIIVDTPPILPVIDSRIMGDHSDQIVFVMAWRQTSKKLARRALTSMGFNQSKLVGVVVTQVDDDVIADQAGLATAHTLGRREPIAEVLRRAA